MKSNSSIVVRIASSKQIVPYGRQANRKAVKLVIEHQEECRMAYMEDGALTNKKQRKTSYGHIVKEVVQMLEKMNLDCTTTY